MKIEPILTPCQEKAKVDLQQFLLDPKSDCIILSAPAGCGKSFLLEHILGDNEDLTNYAKILNVPLCGSSIMAAMSNKAAQVIKGKTFDSVFGLFPKQDYNTGKSYRVKSGGIGNPRYNMVIAIDESSMLDTQGLHLLAEMTEKCKIIFVCDRYQLPPVGEKESPIFTQEFKVTEMVTPVRQDADGDLFALCQSLREGVRTDTLMDLPESEHVRYLDDDEAEAFFTNMSTEDRVLAYTNQTTINLNQYVRSFKGIDGFWKKGEVLVSNGIVKHGTKTIVTNEQVVTVVSEPTDADVHTHAQGFDFVNLSTTAGILRVPADINEYNKVLKRLARQKDWKTLYPLKESMADLRGAWSSTVHKSQGSTYRDVFIHLGDLRKAYFQDKALFLRLLYVAVSRAKRNVYFYGSLF